MIYLVLSSRPWSNWSWTRTSCSNGRSTATTTQKSHHKNFSPSLISGRKPLKPPAHLIRNPLFCHRKGHIPDWLPMSQMLNERTSVSCANRKASSVSSCQIQSDVAREQDSICKMNRLCTVTELDISRPSASLHTDVGSAKDLIIHSSTWRRQLRMKQSHLTCPLSLWDLLLPKPEHYWTTVLAPRSFRNDWPTVSASETRICECLRNWRIST